VAGSRGIFEALHRELLRRLNAVGRIDWSTGVVGRERRVVERTFAHLHNLRRPRTHYERHGALHPAFMLPGCAAVCQRALGA